MITTKIDLKYLTREEFEEISTLETALFDAYKLSDGRRSRLVEGLEKIIMKWLERLPYGSFLELEGICLGVRDTLFCSGGTLAERKFKVLHACGMEDIQLNLDDCRKDYPNDRRHIRNDIVGYVESKAQYISERWVDSKTLGSRLFDGWVEL